MGASCSKEFGSFFMGFPHLLRGNSCDTRTAPHEVPMYSIKCKPTVRIALCLRNETFGDVSQEHDDGECHELKEQMLMDFFG